MSDPVAEVMERMLAPFPTALACAVVRAAGGATGIWRPHAVGEGGVFRGSHAIGPCVDNNWLTLG